MPSSPGAVVVVVVVVVVLDVVELEPLSHTGRPARKDISSKFGSTSTAVPVSSTDWRA